MRPNDLLFAVLLNLTACLCPAQAQQATFRDSLLDRLAGHWTLSGPMAGHPAVHDVAAQWVLNHQYLEFRETSRDKNKSGQPSYVADVFIGWDGPTHQYVCVWLDDYGDISTQSLGHAPHKGDSIKFVFQDSNDPGRFHTTFAYDRASGTWTMDMDNETNGKLSPFARTVLTPSQ
ncbi:MAG: hypothetical protein ABSD74_13415 [Rhizomicrobium sp.]|jgi:hypothetical protein